MRLFSRAELTVGIRLAFSSTANVSVALGTVEVPPDIAAWLGRLYALLGVPFGYLVPDEGMLPPESIRFFRVDRTWTEALVDGAFSLGRNLTDDSQAAAMNLDRAVRPSLGDAGRSAAPARRRRDGRSAEEAAAAAAPGGAGVAGSVEWTGFVMRSRVVAAYPGLGVNAYPAGATGDDPTIALTVRRLDRLGSGGDTLLCIVEGDAAFFDVHEPPEHLHFGLDSYTPPAAPGGLPTATKELRRFTRAANGSVSFLPGTTPLAVGASFRAASPRVLSMSRLAAQVAAANSLSEVDSAEMGFEMTEGVGKVRFLRRDQGGTP